MPYVIGNVLQPVGTDSFAIAHVCNNAGVMGAGVARQIALQFPEAERVYKSACQHMPNGGLGLTMSVPVMFGQRQGVIANMICQTLGRHQFPLHMPYLEDCLNSVAATFPKLSIHLPRIGAGLARGHWEDIAQLIPDAWYVYTLPNEVDYFPDAKYYVSPYYAKVYPELPVAS